MRFFSCDGGPHLVLPNSERDHWGTNHPAANLDPASDYQRACAVAPPFGFVEVGEMQALVLAGNPMITAWEPLPDKDGIDLYIFECWKSVDLELLRALVLAGQSESAVSDTNLDWILPEGGLTLMFAGDRPGHTAYGEISIPIKAGTYRVMRGSYDNEHGKVLILRIVPTNQHG